MAAAAAPTLLILDLNARRLRAKACTLDDAVLSIHHEDVYRFQGSTSTSSIRPAVYPQDILTAVSFVLERARSAMQESIYAIQAITCVVDYDRLPTAKVNQDQQQTLYKLSPARTLAEQLCLHVSEPTEFQDHFLTTHEGSGEAKTISAGTLMRSILAGRLLDVDASEGAHADASAAGATTPGSDTDEHTGNASRHDRFFSVRPDRASAWMVARFGFCASCIVTTGVMSCIASLLSFCPDADDVGIGIGRSDELLVPTTKKIVHPHYKVFPNILAQLDSVDPRLTHRPWLVRVSFTDAGHARNIVRDVFTKTRHAFRQLVQAVCPGGSVGLDSKLFTVYRPADASTTAAAAADSEGSFQRFEKGTRVTEFRDLRANPRCLLEGQALGMRHAYASIKALDGEQDDVTDVGYRGAAGWMAYAPFLADSLPSRWCTWGKPAGDACIASVFTHVLGRPMLVGKADVEAAQDDVGSVQCYVSRATVGAVYLASYLLYRQGSFATTPLSFTAFVRQHACQTSTLVVNRGNPQRIAYGDLTRTGLRTAIDPDTTPRPLHRRQSVWMAAPAWQDELLRSPYGSSLVVVQRERSSSESTDAASRARSSTLSSLQSTAPSETTSDEHDRALDGTITPKPYSVGVISPPASPPSAQSHELVSLAEPDHDFWLFYGAMLEEYNRLVRPV